LERKKERLNPRVLLLYAEGRKKDSGKGSREGGRKA